VKLTRQQYQNLEKYLVDFRARLNQTSTREEAVPLFKDAVVELNKYGLLPRGMSVEQAEKLMISKYQNNNIANLRGKLIRNHLLAQDNDSNFFCLITGETNWTLFIGLLPVSSIVTCLIGLTLVNLAYGHPLLILFEIIGYILFSFSFLGFLSYFLPITLGSVVTLGVIQPPVAPGQYNEYFPSGGWIESFGIVNAKRWVGPFYGNIHALDILYSRFDIGIIGFTGLKLFLPYNCFFLGSALKADISSEPL
jgi:hypothetical protein